MDWTTGRRDRYEFVEVVGGREGALIDGITGGKVTENMETALKVSGSLNYAGVERGWLDKTIRVYLVASDDLGGSARIALGTFLTTTPKLRIRGANAEYTIDMYSRLIIAQDDKLEGSLSLVAGTNIIDAAVALVRAGGLDVTYTPSSAVLTADRVYASGTTALAAVNDLLTLANYASLGVDGYGSAVMNPYRPPNARAVSWTFRDDAAGIFLPDVELERDAYDTPNVVTLTSSNEDTTTTVTATNADPASPYSTVSRGRRIVRVETVTQTPSEADLFVQATRLLADGMMSVESVNLTHSYAPIAMNDVVRFEYVGAGITRTLSVVSKDIELGNGAMTKTRLRWFS